VKRHGSVRFEGLVHWAEMVPWLHRTARSRCNLTSRIYGPSWETVDAVNCMACLALGPFLER